jgi:hypothetical protein
MSSNVFQEFFLIHVGDSKIIRTLGTYFAVGYTDGWA